MKRSILIILHILAMLLVLAGFVSLRDYSVRGRGISWINSSSFEDSIRFSEMVSSDIAGIKRLAVLKKAFETDNSLDEEKTPAELSNGMKIKYALALALSHGAELLILDEPTSGLDPVSREELVEIFLKLKDEGKTVFFSTHITSDLEKCADRILFLQEGKLKADEELETFRENWRIAECGKEIPEELKATAKGCCRVRDGYTVLIRKEEAGNTETRAASLEEIMIHLEKEGEEA